MLLFDQLCQVLMLLVKDHITFEISMSKNGKVWMAVVQKGSQYEFNKTIWGTTTRYYLDPINTFSFPSNFILCNMTSLFTSLATALTAIVSQSGDSQVVNIFTELQLYLEHNKNQLDSANAKNVRLEAELNQVNGELNAVSQSLAMALARPASSNPLGGAQAPKLSKIFADPGMYDGSRGKKFEEWWARIHAWQDENSTALTGSAGICAVLSRMIGRDASTFAHAQLNEMIREKKWTWLKETSSPQMKRTGTGKLCHP